MCGGEVLYVPCSRVLHYAAERSPMTHGDRKKANHYLHNAGLIIKVKRLVLCKIYRWILTNDGSSLMCEEVTVTRLCTTKCCYTKATVKPLFIITSIFLVSLIILDFQLPCVVFNQQKNI